MPLALELQRRGHEVLVACGATVGQYAATDWYPDRRRGPRSRPGPALRGSRSDASAEYVARGSGPCREAAFVETFAMALVGDLRRIAEEWRPDVMMRDRSEYAAWVVGDAIGAPVVTLTFGRLPQPAFEIDAAGDALQELRRSQGLGPELSTLLRRTGPRTGTTLVRRFDRVECYRTCRSYSRYRMTLLAALSFLHGSRISGRARLST